MSVVDYYMDFALLSSCARKRLLGIRDEIRSVNKDDMIDALPRLFKTLQTFCCLNIKRVAR